MKVKLLTNSGYEALNACVGKVVEVESHYKSKDGTIETACIKGKALLEIGADPEKVMPEYTYVMSLLDLPERGGKGLEAVKV